MYVCKSAEKANSDFAQLELSDYFGIKRIITFDLDDPSEARKAKKVLRPKGIGRRRRSAPKYKKNLMQQDLARKKATKRKVTKKKATKKKVTKKKPAKRRTKKKVTKRKK